MTKEQTKQIGIVGLGQMGGNLARQAMEKGTAALGATLFLSQQSGV